MLQGGGGWPWTSGMWCCQLPSELEGDSRHQLGSVCCHGHTDLFYPLVFANRRQLAAVVHTPGRAERAGLVAAELWRCW